MYCFTNIIKRFKKMEIQSAQPQELAAIPVIYIRHAQSLFNLWEAYLHQQSSAKDRTEDIFSDVKSKFDLKLLDPHLSTKGRMQAGTCDLYHSIPITTVFVSPLRRALETCDAIFSSHPNTFKSLAGQAARIHKK